MEIIALLIAFCGGVFAAALGALTAFVFTGIAGFLGVAMMVAGVDAWMGLVPFGFYFGPHLSFAAGVVAVAYARKRGYVETGKDIVTPLISLRKLDVLLVGGIAGVVGHIVNWGLNQVIPGRLDTIALTIVIVSIATKVLFGDLGLGEVFGVAPDEVKKLGGRFSAKVDAWVPYQSKGLEKLFLGLTVGGLSGYVAYIMLQNPQTAGASIFVGFTISVISLLFLQQGMPMPVTHHMALGGAYAVLMGGSIAWGFAGGVMGAFLADFFARAFHEYGDVHIDPPSCSIATNSFLCFAVFSWLNVYSMGDTVAYAIIGIFVLISVVEYVAVPREVADVEAA